MPEAGSASLPTAGTVPHTDDDSSPDLVEIPGPYPHEMQYGASTRAHDSCGGLLHCSRVCRGEKWLFTVALEMVVCHSWFVCLSGVAF